jgi:ATP-binding cassette subfamily B protein
MVAKKQYSTSIRRVLSVFLRCLKPYWFQAVSICFCVVASEVLASLVVPQVLRAIVDTLTSPFSQTTQATLFQLFWWMCLIYFSYWVFYRIAGFLQAFCQTRVSRDLDVYSLAETLKHSYRFFQDEFSGRLMRKIQRFSDSFENIFSWTINTILPLLVTLVGVTIILWRESWVLGLGMLIWFCIFVATNYGISMWKLKYDLIRSEKNTIQNGTMSDILSNAATVKAFGRESYEGTLFSGVREDARKARMVSWVLGDTSIGIQYFFTLLLELIVIYVAIQKWEVGALTVGAFVMYQAYIRSVSQGVWGFGRLIRDFYESFADAKEMIDIMDMQPDVVDASGAKKLKVTEGRIEFKDVRFVYKEGRTVLNDFSLKITPHEKVAFVGSSGAGKSTVTKLLFRLYDVSEGAILVDGQDISRVTQASLRDAISLVPQEPILFHRSLRDNIAYGRPGAKDKEIIAAAKKAHCHEFIVGLSKRYDTLVGERGIKLSGGERQRVAIARAILKNAPILVLDEATSSLDSESEALIQDALRQLMKDKTVIVIAHRLSTIMQMDRIVVIEHGGVTDMGTHDELLKKVGVYQKLWNIQAGGFSSVVH